MPIMVRNMSLIVDDGLKLECKFFFALLYFILTLPGRNRLNPYNETIDHGLRVALD
jgi:hypothetical protein